MPLQCNILFPVSYTHLDVYKRQVYTNSGGSENSDEQEKIFVEAANKLAEDIRKIDGVERVASFCPAQQTR